MKIFKWCYENLDFDSLLLALSGLVAIIFGIVSFIGFIPISGEQLSSILISSLGILMASVVALTVRRKSEIKELKESVGISETKIVYSTRELENYFASSARQAKRFILDTSLNRVLLEPTPVKFFSGIEDGYRRVVYDRTSKGQISFKRIEIIYHQASLEWVIFRLLLHEGHDYQIRHYDSPDKPIPMLSLVSFDNTTFYVGGFYLKGAPTEESALKANEPNLGIILAEYWDTFWNNATPLNEGGAIDWTELKRIGARIGVDKKNFEAMVKRLEEDVAQEQEKVR